MTHEECEFAARAAFESVAAMTRLLSVVVVPVVGGGSPAIYSNIPCLMNRVPAGRVDGTTVQANDEVIRLRTAALTAGVKIKPGDYFEGWPDGFQRNVITAHQTAGEAVWVCVVRRIFA